MKKKIIPIIIVVLLLIILGIIIVIYVNDKNSQNINTQDTNMMDSNMGTPPDKPDGNGGGSGGNSSSNVSHTGATEVSSDIANNGESYSSTEDSQNALLVIGGTSTLTNPTITKSGDSSGDNSDFYGTNAAVLVKEGTLNINGGTVTLNAKNQKITGNILVDNISTLDLSLKNGSSYTGTINSENTAKTINITLDSSSSITLTGDSYITSLNNEVANNSNINFNGYKLYVNGTSIN